jgi:hypothetical protein
MGGPAAAPAVVMVPTAISLFAQTYHTSRRLVTEQRTTSTHLWRSDLGRVDGKVAARRGESGRSGRPLNDKKLSNLSGQKGPRSGHSRWPAKL